MDLKAAFKDMPVLLTGAKGFMGSYLARSLAETGADLSLIVKPGKIDVDVPGRPPLPTKAKCFEADIRDKALMNQIVEKVRPAIVFHLAALTDVSRDPELQEACMAINFQGVIHVAEASLAQSVRRFVTIGTCEEYGDHQAPFTEDLSPKPVSPYSDSKAKATLRLLEMHETEGLPVVILRPFLAYGPGQHPSRFLSQAVRAAVRGERLRMTSGQQTREFNHVEGLVEGILRAGVKEGIDGEIINLCTQDERKLIDVARLIYRLAGSDLEPETRALDYRSGEAMRFCGSTEKCVRLLDFNPRIRLEEGLTRLIEWERAQQADRGGQTPGERKDNEGEPNA